MAVLEIHIFYNGIRISDPGAVLKGDTCGYELINAFANKLNADIQINSGAGTEVVLRVQDYNKI